MLAAAGCVILLLEAFAPTLRRWFSSLALARNRRLALGPRPRSHGHDLRRPLRDLAADAAHRSLPRRLRRPRGSRRQAVSRAGGRGEGRVLRAPPLGAPGRLPDDAGPRSADRVHRARDPVARVLRPRRLLPARRSLLRGGAEILPDRGLRLGVHTLRRGAALRRRRQLDDRGPFASRPRGEPRRRLRPRSPPRGVRIQDVARAVPRVGARRLPGHADARRPLPLGCPQGARASSCSTGSSPRCSRTACPTSSGPRSRLWPSCR